MCIIQSDHLVRVKIAGKNFNFTIVFFLLFFHSIIIHYYAFSFFFFPEFFWFIDPFSCLFFWCFCFCLCDWHLFVCYVLLFDRISHSQFSMISRWSSSSSPSSSNWRDEKGEIFQFDSFIHLFIQEEKNLSSILVISNMMMMWESFEMFINNSMLLLLFLYHHSCYQLIKLIRIFILIHQLCSHHIHTHMYYIFEMLQLCLVLVCRCCCCLFSCFFLLLLKLCSIIIITIKSLVEHR